MFFRKKSHTIRIRNFEPLTASSFAVERKTKLREEIKKQTKNLDEIRKFCHDEELSIDVRFFLYDGSKDQNPQPEGRIKKDLDNLLKIVLDVLPEKMDSEGENDGLGLIKRDYDHLVYEIKSIKKIVYDKDEEGIDIVITK
ncbi:RusA family crossover junction endodeoxyribonuclease [Nitrosopumilus sp.]|uniref:RusA family crossover junction endodeoxyribonuclease n=1 Tax=Nitrosopumilus sp. TaxID=2024843 RepID=UPI00247BE1F6|nr:RusA family crossover junction endodeoxyribonuclease [Nitrosopumilus sp.]MCV0409377.1 RusA family crossover junction endodeoxyribonuclease [Nitrosopumilus sp.]